MLSTQAEVHMKRLVGRPVLRGCAVLGLLAAGACGDGQEPIRPETIAIQAGNNQNGATGSALPVPLQVLVSGSDGLPYSNATVQWAVTSGSATVSPTTSTTDLAGLASTVLTLGSTVGDVVVTATVSGITPVSFTATVIDACAVAEAHTIGSTIEGTLVTTDCRLSDGTYTDQLTFLLTAADAIRFTLNSAAFNAFLGVLDESGTPIAFRDDISETDRNASLLVFLAPGSYVVSPSGFGPADLGAYTFTSAAVTEDVTGCDLFATWLVPGVQLTQTLSDTDCVLEDVDSNQYYGDVYFLRLAQNDSITVTQTSTVVNTYIELYRVTSNDFVFQEFNDDEAAGSTNSRLTFTVPQAGIYMLLPSSSAPQEKGAYTLAIE